jgi:hypothetical protein
MLHVACEGSGGEPPLGDDLLAMRGLRAEVATAEGGSGTGLMT